MLVSDIEITQYHYDAGQARHCANVAMSLTDRTVSLYCQVDLPQGGDTATHQKELAGEAVRQLRRMPEFRSGKQELKLADHLLA